MSDHLSYCFAVLALINALVVGIPFGFFSNLSASQFETLAVWINTTCTSQSLRDTFPNLSIGDLVRDSFNALTVYLLFAVYASVVSLCLVVIFYMLKPGQDSHNFSQDQLDKMTPDELEKILETSLKLWWQRGRFLLRDRFIHYFGFFDFSPSTFWLLL